MLHTIYSQLQMNEIFAKYCILFITFYVLYALYYIPHFICFVYMLNIAVYIE